MRLVQANFSFRDSVPASVKTWIRRFEGYAYSTLEDVYATFVMTRDACLMCVAGDMAECGVFSGVHPALMAHTLDLPGVPGDVRKVHLYDSFEGIPHATERDTDNIDGTLFNAPRDGALKTTGISACPVSGVLTHIERWGVNTNRLVFHKGWFQDTTPLHEGPLAVLRLDGDLYESTLVCLRNLYHHVSPGGFIVLDDYGLAGCKAATHEFLAEHGLDPVVTRLRNPAGKDTVYWRKDVNP
jgi:hypothetical protein